MLLVKLDVPSPRARYSVQHIIRGILGWQMEFVSSEEEFKNASGPKLHYGASELDRADVFHVPSSGWFDRADIVAFDPPMGNIRQMPVLFPIVEEHDLFAATFYLLSRYEEYTSTDRDTHGRFPTTSHFVVRHGLERTPIVDHWAYDLAHRLRERFPELTLPARKYHQTVTIDVDNGLRYLGRPVWKQFGATVRDLVTGKMDLVSDRVSTHIGKQPDPYDRYAELAELLRRQNIDRAIFFFLMKGEGRFDHASDPDNPLMVKAIKQVSSVVQCGVHPSYESSDRPALIGSEVEHLSRISGSPIELSRQHFLRWRMPETLRELERLGIKEEHSLGFSDRSGFRAGTCTPFKWYDLQQERVSDLELHPFAVMDSALLHRQGSDPMSAANEMIAISEAVRSVQGGFASVWHDRFLSGHGQWENGPGIFRYVIEHAAP